MFKITVNNEKGWFLTNQEKQELDKILFLKSNPEKDEEQVQ